MRRSDYKRCQKGNPQNGPCLKYAWQFYGTTVPSEMSLIRNLGAFVTIEEDPDAISSSQI